MGKSAGGLNISACKPETKLKLLRNVSKKKERKKGCGIQWVHLCYGKQGTIWGTKAAQASWMVHKILNTHGYFTSPCMNMGCGQGYESIGPTNRMHCNTHNDKTLQRFHWILEAEAIGWHEVTSIANGEVLNKTIIPED
ncbi:hypothetical protein H5410_033790 [Solanum commersonii]|uniref:Uncharacterized protein n=1 Tax=Solanum commersonii TaxID=4109 RepID=A0A9J5YTM3_SOLCO|nr:hypothetical protein H5410_033790 [Solanum commersonii]